VEIDATDSAEHTSLRVAIAAVWADRNSIDLRRQDHSPPPCTPARRTPGTRFGDVARSHVLSPIRLFGAAALAVFAAATRCCRAVLVASIGGL